MPAMLRGYPPSQTDRETELPGRGQPKRSARPWSLLMLWFSLDAQERRSVPRRELTNTEMSPPQIYDLVESNLRCSDEADIYDQAFLHMIGPRKAASHRCRAYVLLSGGIDSAACVAYYTKKDIRVQAVFVDYGQKAAQRESAAALAVAEHYEVELHTLDFRGNRPKAVGFVPARNAFLIFAAVMELEINSGLLAMGVHAGAAYWDCSAEFAASAQRLLTGYTDGSVQLDFPFLDWVKSDILQFCMTSGVPVELTYSCEVGGDPPCHCCASCKEREGYAVV